MGISIEFGFVSGHDFSRAIKGVERELGFTGCGKMPCTKGTASAVPYKNRIVEGFSPWGTLFVVPRAFSRLETAAKSRGRGFAVWDVAGGGAFTNPVWRVRT